MVCNLIHRASEFIVATLSFDSSGNLFAHALSRRDLNFAAQTGSPLFTWMISTATQLASMTAPLVLNDNIPCPIAEFVTDLSTDLFLDINEQLAFQGFVRPVSNSVNNYISLSFSNRSIVNVNVTANDQVALSSSGAMTRNIGFTIDTFGMTAPGKSEVRISANGATLRCSNSSQTSVLRVACPPGRFMELVKDGMIHKLQPETVVASTGDFNQCVDLGNGQWYGKFQYDIPAGTSQDSNGATVGTQRTGIYDCALYGPPIYAFYSDAYQPNIGRFQYTSAGGQSYSLATATLLDLNNRQFALEEVYGRSTFTYNATNADVGCKYPAQTWQEIRNTYGSGGLSVFESWNTSTYAPCTDPQRSGAKGSLTDIYQLITPNNALRWTGTIDGYYIFRGRIIDPTYSFCDMPVYFGVRVYGAPIQDSIQASLVFGIIAAVGAMLVASYYWYRNVRRGTMTGLGGAGTVVGWGKGQLSLASN